MFLVTVRVVGGRAATAGECSALRVETVASDRTGAIDHVYAQSSRSGMELVVFAVADSVEIAEKSVRIAVEAALPRVPGFEAVVEDCAVALFVPRAGAVLWPDP